MRQKTRKQSENDGDKRFYTGIPCRQGHDSFRYTSTGNCCACITIYRRNYRKNNRKGMRLFQVYVYPQNLQPLKEMAKAMNVAVELMQ
jgi:hypothetical protein